uniref:DUF1618 domain-containing protein n=2 Tax=Oryza sativa subsp. japonica TaxID=39947 RepID=Q53PG7_ORYSJ|nr:hypothetical protein LOC_Os11g07350 [Oryza sativa Japonica Group]ABA91748.1 hypothetical protein LOC_Os11g07350 [Oryza sativa Japonica Group]
MSACSITSSTTPAPSPPTRPPQPPSLSLLPAYVTKAADDEECEEWQAYEEESETWPRHHHQIHHHLDEKTTGLLRRGDDDMVVVDLAVLEGHGLEEEGDAELLVLRSGEWTVTRAPVAHFVGRADKPPSWITDMAIPVSERRMCWADLYRGIILCDDVFDQNPQLRFVPLPPEALTDETDDGYKRDYAITDRRVCATDGGAALKFIYIISRCCCGLPGTTFCDNSKEAFIIKTWILRMDDDDDMVWTMDAMVDATELWSLHACAGLPQAKPIFPVASMDDPHLICFMVQEREFEGRRRRYCHIKRTWMVMFDTRSKKLLSVCSCRDSWLI